MKERKTCYTQYINTDAVHYYGYIVRILIMTAVNIINGCERAIKLMRHTANFNEALKCEPSAHTCYIYQGRSQGGFGGFGRTTLPGSKQKKLNFLYTCIAS